MPLHTWLLLRPNDRWLFPIPDLKPRAFSFLPLYRRTIVQQKTKFKPSANLSNNPNTAAMHLVLNLFDLRISGPQLLSPFYLPCKKLIFVRLQIFLHDGCNFLHPEELLPMQKVMSVVIGVLNLVKNYSWLAFFEIFCTNTKTKFQIKLHKMHFCSLQKFICSLHS